ncbi:ABC1 kinase family protein [Labedaea rhizosphaerae]|uniref:Ubiquinone biosynthesis protein n=1 Tax=Labedaea rhizosphaerae TaxID=598644 RepID=A0A4R6SFP3_LABRH|nr:AarF/UbiB family protein [Labedaea rhizosphaerae]TDQ00317.1 ubiquinone biosynthesis protein [Labedaea rhizosphaerae]
MNQFSVRRVLRVTWLVVAAAPRLLAAFAGPRERRRGRVAAELCGLLERAGGAFIKAGQLIGTRVDLIGETMARSLSKLQDEVAGMTAAELAQALRDAPEPVRRHVLEAGSPVASGSIASVYRVRIGDRVLAVKVLRPGVRTVIAADMAILRAGAAFAAHLPGFRRAPLADIMDQLGESLVAQTDFVAEAENLERLRAHLAVVAGVAVPAVVRELCAEGVITMEFIDDLRHGSIELLPVTAREAGVATLVRATYRLLFVAGFVHADLHQGNTYFRADGTIVVLDAGFTYQLSPAARRSFTEFFAGMIRADGEACADILYGTVRGAAPGADVGAFRRDIAELVMRNTGNAVRDFSLPKFCFELFAVQRRHGLYAEPAFIFPMLCLLSLEGVVKAHHPAMEFQIEAAPFVMQGMLADQA